MRVQKYETIFNAGHGNRGSIDGVGGRYRKCNIFYGSFELKLVGRSAKRVLWENSLSLKRSAPKTRQKRSDCFANALPQQQQLQLRGALHLVGFAVV